MKTNAQLRTFGLTLAVPFALLGGYFWWKGYAAAPYMAGVSFFLALSALLGPAVLRPVEKGWMMLAEGLNWVMTRVILTVAFLLVILPIGLLLRVMGKDLLDRKIQPDLDSYWQPASRDESTADPKNPY